MRGIACLLVLITFSEMAFAAEAPSSTLPQSSASGKSAKETADIKERVAFWLNTCLTDWDAATHMTRKEWRSVCHRVAAERGTFLLQNADFFSMTPRRR